MNQQQMKLASAALLLAIVAIFVNARALASPLSAASHHGQHDQEQDELQGNEDGAHSMASRAANQQQEPDNEFGGTFTGPAGGYGDPGNLQHLSSAHNSFRPSNQEAQASENSENQADDDEANEDDDSAAGFEVGAGGSRRAAAAQALVESAQPWLEGSQVEGVAATEGDLEGALGADSNIANAKIEMSPQDRATAAGHHHHHGHYVHGWLKMGAETGKKGAFKWHDKHPVGGKGRR